MASVLMIAASSALFVYWFRCTCLLLLAQKQSPEYALKVASTVRLNFQVQEELEAQPDQLDLDRLYAGLEDDYRMLTDLLRQVTGSESIDQKLLMTGLQGDAGLVQAGARSGPWSVRHQATHRDVSHTRLFRRRARPQRCRLIVIPGNQKNDEDSDRLLPLIQVSRTENKLALEFRKL